MLYSIEKSTINQLKYTTTNTYENKSEWTVQKPGGFYKTKKQVEKLSQQNQK